MSKPLSILATILLLIVPTLLTDRCASEGPAVPRSAATTDAGTAAPEEPVDSSGHGARRPPRAAHVKWVFVAQAVVISIVHHVVADRVGEDR
jgi:hypothetical protein